MAYRILFLADIDSAHTRKWAVSLHQRENQIGIFSTRKSTTHWYKDFPGIAVFDSNGFGKEKFSGSDAGKLDYLKLLPSLKKVIAEFKPQLVHAHYATSYGLLGVRSGFHPLIISVWGSDVYEFPKKSFIHRFIVKRNLRKADAVFSTSEVMNAEVKKLGRRDAYITPFGVDMKAYTTLHVPPMFDEETKVIGTIKTLETHYGIDVLIRAFDYTKQRYKGKLKLVICGGGTQEEQLKRQAAELKISEDIIFTGAIPQEKVPEYLNRFHIFANLSYQESFGVAVLEAMACAVPCIVSDAPGLKEITANGKYAEMVSVGDHEAAGRAMLNLLQSDEARNDLRARAFTHVAHQYDWNLTLDKVTKIYEQLVKGEHP